MRRRGRRDRADELFAMLRLDVLAQFGEKTRRPFALFFARFGVEFGLASALFVRRHATIVVLEVLALTRLKVEPREGERANVRKKGIDERTILVLYDRRVRRYCEIVTTYLRLLPSLRLSPPCRWTFLNALRFVSISTGRIAVASSPKGREGGVPSRDANSSNQSSMCIHPRWVRGVADKSVQRNANLKNASVFYMLTFVVFARDISGYSGTLHRHPGSCLLACCLVFGDGQRFQTPTEASQSQFSRSSYLSLASTANGKDKDVASTIATC